MTLYISQICGGPELRNSPIDRSIARIFALRGTDHEQLAGSLDVVFHVPGSLLTPEHVGVRTGRFSKREQTLMIQIGVPRAILAADSTAIEAFIIQSLRDAIQVATGRFKKAAVPLDADGHLAVVDRIAAALRH